MMYSIYAIKSLSSNRIYIGQTNDVNRRLEEHNAGIVRTTKSDLPWELIDIKKVSSRGEAVWIEKSLKNSHKKREIWVEKNKIVRNAVY